MKKNIRQTFEPRVRFNWGFHDAVRDARDGAAVYYVYPPGDATARAAELS